MASSNNIADQIADAVQSAVNSKDFSNLQATIDRSIDAAAESIGKGVAQVSDGIRRGQEQYARMQERKRVEARMNELYASPSAQRGAGVALVAAACCVGIPLAALGGLFSLVGAAVGPALVVMGALGGAGLLITGVRKLSFAKRFDRYRSAIGLRESCTIADLATACGEKAASVARNARTMVSRGLFKQATFDEGSGLLLMTPEAAERHRQAQAAQLERKRRQDLAASVAPASQADPTPDQRRLLERGEAFIAQIRTSNDAIPGAQISATLDQIERVVRAIFDLAAENPEVTGDLDQFMDYYLPTMVKLLDAYRDLDGQPVQSPSVRKSKQEIEGALASLNTAFEKLLDSLLREKAIDVSSDISVLKTVLAQEGLVASPFDATGNAGSSTNPNAADR